MIGNLSVFRSIEAAITSISRESEIPHSEIHNMDTEKASETASESDFFLNDGTAKDKSMTVRVWPWKLSTVFFAVLSLVVFLESVSVRNFRSSFNETLSVDYQASDFRNKSMLLNIDRGRNH